MIWRILLDENFRYDIIERLVTRGLKMDIVAVRDIPELVSQDDATVLAWATKNQRIIMTHDVRTLTKDAYDRVRAGLPMLGVIEVRLLAPIGLVVEDLHILLEAGHPSEFENLVTHIPMH